MNKNKSKESNPKDIRAVKKWGRFSCVPWPVIWEVCAALDEGSRKYGRHNWREAGVLYSVYFDATLRHLTAHWEHEDLDPDSGLSHITKAIASLIVLRDAMIQENYIDDRPPKSNVKETRERLQKQVEVLFKLYPKSVKPFTEK